MTSPGLLRLRLHRLTPPPPLLVLNAPATQAFVGVPYDYTPVIEGGLPPYSAVLDGAPPSGIEYSPAPIGVRGTPDTEETASGLVLLVRDSSVPPAEVTVGPWAIDVDPAALNYDDADLDAAIAAHGAAGDTTILIASASQGGSFAASRNLDLHPTGRLTIKGANPSEKTQLASIVLASGFKDVTLENLSTGDDTSTSGYCIQGSNTLSLGPENLFLRNVDAHGAPFDHTGATDYQLAAPTNRSGLEGRYRNMVWDGGVLEYLYNAVKPTEAANNITIKNLVMRRLYSDAFSIGVSNTSGLVVLKDCFMTQFVGLQSDIDPSHGGHSPGDGPHCDTAQFTNQSAGQTAKDILIEGCIYLQGHARASAQGLAFSTSAGAGSSNRRTQMLDNINATRAAEPQAPGMDKQVNGFASRLFAVRENPGNTGGQSTSALTSIPGEIPSIMVDCVGESFPQNGGTQLVNCIVIPNTLEYYSAAFEGPFPIPDDATRADVAAAFRCRADGPLAHLRDVYDFATGETLVPHRAAVALTDVVDQELSATGSSAVIRIFGGSPGMEISITGPGATFQLGPNEDGSGMGSAITSGVVPDLETFVKVNWAAASTYSTPREISLTVDGETYRMVVATKANPASSRVRVANGGTAYSTMGTPASNAGRTKLWWAFRTRRIGPTNSGGSFSVGRKTIAAGPTGSTFKDEFTAGSRPRSGVGSGSILLASDNVSDDKLWHTYMRCVDFVQTDPSLLYKAWRDHRRTIITPGGAYRTDGGYSFNPSSLMSLLTLFGESDGGNLVNAEMEFFICGWGAGSYALPNFDDPDVRMCLNPDRAGADGSGINGVGANLYFYGDSAAGWNAGLANRGSEAGMTMVKQAGTYVLAA